MTVPHSPTSPSAPPYELGPMPAHSRMRQLDELVVNAPVARIFELARKVDEWPAHLAHYNFVRFRGAVRSDGGGLVEMSADRPFGPVGWPTWWLSEMSVDHKRPAVRFRHVDGITTGMDVEWTFDPIPGSDRTVVRILHLWDGPRWPVIAPFAATVVIGPVFVHGIAQRTLAGLARVAERRP